MKKFIIGGVLSLIFCCGALLGTSFAWFTYSVENTGNTFYAGAANVFELNGDSAEQELLGGTLGYRTATVTLKNTGTNPLKISLKSEISGSKVVSNDYDVLWREHSSLTETLLGTMAQLSNGKEVCGLSANESITLVLLIRKKSNTESEVNDITFTVKLSVSEN